MMTTGKLTFSWFITVFNSPDSESPRISPGGWLRSWLPPSALALQAAGRTAGSSPLGPDACVDVGLLEGQSGKLAFLGVSHFVGDPNSPFCRNNRSSIPKDLEGISMN